jgi:WD40 repeat protein
VGQQPPRHHLTQAGTLAAVAFGPDNHTLATGSVERALTIWDTASRTVLATTTGHNGPITAVAYAPDGHTVATASADKSIALWNTDPDTAITTICHTVNRDLTPEEWNKFLPNTPRHPTCAR